MASHSAATATPARPAAAARALQRRCACGARAGTSGQCTTCNEKRKRIDSLQTRAAGSARDGAPAGLPPQVDAVLASSGRPLDAATREFFETRFGHGFGDVRIHADSARADAAARAVNAHAFTAGRDIVFAAGQYRAGSPASMRLLAHELTHVVQQRFGRAARGIGRADDPAEREAERNADRLETDRPPSFTARARGAIARRTETTVTAPSGPTDCSLEHHHAIEPAVHLAQQWLATSVRRLDSYAGAPADAGNAGVRQALQNHFSTTNAAHATTLRGRLETIRTDLTQRDPFTAECHDASDTECAIAGAYVPGDNQSMVVFCPNFFAGHRTVRSRAGTLIHEMAHALLGLNIADRAYENDRLLPRMSAAEAFDNAESHAMLAEELGTGSEVRGNPPQDEVEECPESTEERIRNSLARAQRWNRDANNIASDTRASMVADSGPLFTRHLGDNLPATRSAAQQRFNRIEERLRSPIDVRCDTEPAAECATRDAYRKPARDNLALGVGLGAAIGGGAGLIAGLAGGLGAASLGLGLGLGLGLLGLGLIVGAIVGAATSRPDRVHVCPSWAALHSDSERSESLLAAIYETYAGLDVTQSLANARLARALHERYIGTPPSI